METYYRAQGSLLVFCGDLNEKEIPKIGDICTYTADSLCCTVDINRTL